MQPLCAMTIKSEKKANWKKDNWHKMRSVFKYFPLKCRRNKVRSLLHNDHFFLHRNITPVVIACLLSDEKNVSIPRMIPQKATIIQFHGKWHKLYNLLIRWHFKENSRSLFLISCSCYSALYVRRCSIKWHLIPVWCVDEIVFLLLRSSPFFPVVSCQSHMSRLLLKTIAKHRKPLHLPCVHVTYNNRIILLQAIYSEMLHSKV